MEEQKQPKLSIVDTYNNLSLCVKVQGDPKELRIADFYAYTKEEAMANAQLFLRATELLEQLKQLKEENERQSDLLETLEDIQKILDTNKSLTEQVEKLKQWNENYREELNHMTGRRDNWKTKYELLSRNYQEDIGSGMDELSRLRDERKELVEALMESFNCMRYVGFANVPQDWLEQTMDLRKKIESLLSKVKQ